MTIVKNELKNEAYVGEVSVDDALEIILNDIVTIGSAISIKSAIEQDQKAADAIQSLSKAYSALRSSKWLAED